MSDNDYVVIGHKNSLQGIPFNCIVIGDFGQAHRPYEFVIEVALGTLRTVLTKEEHAVLSKVIRRMDVEYHQMH